MFLFNSTPDWLVIRWLKRTQEKWQMLMDLFIRYVKFKTCSLGMPSKKNSIWRDIVPTKGGEGVKKWKCPYLKYHFTRELFLGGEGVRSSFHLAFLLKLVLMLKNLLNNFPLTLSMIYQFSHFLQLVSHFCIFW